MAQNPAQAQFSWLSGWEGQNGVATFIDTSARILAFSPQTRPGDTRRVWFYMGAAGWSRFRNFTLRLTYEQASYAPTQLACSYDAKTWFRVERQMNTGFADYQVPLQGDTLYWATGYPYTPKDLAASFPRWKEVAQIDSFCLTKHGRFVYRIQTQGDPNRPLLVFTGRQHAFESPTSYALEGLMDFLLGPSAEAQALRKKYQLVFLPMFDVDMVTIGGTGKDQLPQDFNRSWTAKSPWNAVKSFQIWVGQQERSGRTIAGYMDFHSPFPVDKKSSHYYNTYPKGSRIGACVDTLFAEYACLEGIKPLPVSRSNNPPPKPGERVVRHFMVGENPADPSLPRLKGLRFSTTFEQAWDFRSDGKPYTQEALRQSGENLGRAIYRVLQTP